MPGQPAQIDELISHLDRHHVRLEEFGCLVALSHDGTMIFDCRILANGLPELLMGNEFRSSRDVIIRTDALAEAAEFYGSVLGLPAVQHSDTLIGFETGAFCLYVEKGAKHGPVFEFLVTDMEDARRRLVSAGCTVVEEDASIPRCYILDPYGVVFNIVQALKNDSSIGASS